MAYTRFPPRDTTLPSLPPARAPEQSNTDGLQRHRSGVALQTPRQTAATLAPIESLNPFVLVFVLSLFVPLVMSAGGLALTPARLVMILLMIPVGIMFASGRAGRILTSDILMIGFTFWMAITILVYGGTAQIEFVGISAIEILCPYLLARCLIRNQAQFEALLRVLKIVIAVIALLAAIEAITGRGLLSMAFDTIGRVHGQVPERYDRRLGMIRAQSGFQHPILFGVVMALLFGPLFFARRRDGQQTGLWTAIFPGAAVFFSLSVGAWLAVFIQVGLIVWNLALRTVPRRWTILLILTAIGYVTIDLLSNRTPIEVAFSYLTFSSHNAYWRKLIFEYGMENVWRSPIFGLGLGDWTRPSWMHSSSVDNYWLLNAMRHGIPGFLLVTGAYAAVLLHLARARLSDVVRNGYRLGMIFALIGVAFSISTVHVWGTPFYMIQFMLGAGLWMVHAPQESPAAETAAGPSLTRETGSLGAAAARVGRVQSASQPQRAEIPRGSASVSPAMARRPAIERAARNR